MTNLTQQAPAQQQAYVAPAQQQAPVYAAPAQQAPAYAAPAQQQAPQQFAPQQQQAQQPVGGNDFFEGITAPVDGTYDMNAKVIIPKGTILESLLDLAVWKVVTPFAKAGEAQQPDSEIIEIKWTVTEPGDYQGVVLFQKLKVKDVTEKTRQRALGMLAAIDANAKGDIMRAGCMPDPVSLSMGLDNTPMKIKVAEYDMNGSVGNWVDAVYKHGMVQQAPQQQMGVNQAINQAVQNVQQQAPAQQAPQQQAPAQQAPAQQAPQQQAPQQQAPQQQAPAYAAPAQQQAPQQQAPAQQFADASATNAQLVNEEIAVDQSAPQPNLENAQLAAGGAIPF